MVLYIFEVGFFFILNLTLTGFDPFIFGVLLQRFVVSLLVSLDSFIC